VTSCSYDNIFWLADIYGGIAKSTNSGETWTEQYTGVESSLNNKVDHMLCISKNNVMLGNNLMLQYDVILGQKGQKRNSVLMTGQKFLMIPMNTPHSRNNGQ